MFSDERTDSLNAVENSLVHQFLDGLSDREAAEAAVEAVIVLARDLQVPTSLSQFGVTDGHIKDLACGVMKVERLLANNPRTLTLEDAEAIYRRVL